MFFVGIIFSFRESLLYNDRDNDLHRLLFMPNGLPDGTELAYYARGKVTIFKLTIRYSIFVMHASFVMQNFLQFCRKYLTATSKGTV